MSKAVIDLLEPSAVCLHLDSPDSKAIIHILSTRLYEAGYVRDSFVDAVLNREASMPTGLPLDGTFNAAIPHADVEHVIKPGLALATLAQPVPFQNMIEPEASLLVQLVIVMALNQPKAQVEMLMAIAEILQNPPVIKQLMQADTYEDVVHALLVADQHVS